MGVARDLGYLTVPGQTLVELKSDAAVKAVGKMRVEGKDYVVRDGDIIHFRFNV